MTDDLDAWLRVQLDEDERVAEAARHGAVGRWEQGGAGYNGATVEYEGHPDGWPSHAAGDGVVVYDEGVPSREQARHIARWDPARALGDIAADRRIIQMFEQRAQEGRQPGGEVFGYHATGLLIAIRCRAEVYADRDGYREEWRP